MNLAFVLEQIAHVVALCEYAPNLWPEAECVWQQLEDDEAMGWAVAVPAQRRQTKCMCRAVGDVEATLAGKYLLSCVV
jgi:hypothetical protein